MASNCSNNLLIAPAVVSFSRNIQIVRASGTQSSNPSPRNRINDSRSLMRNSARSSERSVKSLYSRVIERTIQQIRDDPPMWAKGCPKAFDEYLKCHEELQRMAI